MATSFASRRRTVRPCSELPTRQSSPITSSRRGECRALLAARSPRNLDLGDEAAGADGARVHQVDLAYGTALLPAELVQVREERRVRARHRGMVAFDAGVDDHRAREHVELELTESRRTIRDRTTDPRAELGHRRLARIIEEEREGSAVLAQPERSDFGEQSLHRFT